MTDTMSKPRIVTPDNGYFEVWARPCGHTVRVTTEDTGWQRRNPIERKRLRELDAERLAARPCRQCSECPDHFIGTRTLRCAGCGATA